MTTVFMVGVSGDQQWPEILVPAVDEEDDEKRSDVGARHRQQDVDEEADRTGAIERGQPPSVRPEWS
jgi:hypothetical protein